MKILFYNLSELRFTVATPDTEPLGGSESCVSYLARQLARNGHDVTLMALAPEHAPPVVMGVRHFPPSLIKDKAFFAAEKFDAIIANNAALACPFLREASPQSFLLLWDHVPPDQPSMQAFGNPVVRDSVDDVVFVSEWQKTETEKLFGAVKSSGVIGNGLTPSFENMFSSPQDLLKAKENRAAYTVIPYRGLPFLLQAMQGLATGTALDIFSSMRVYQIADDKDTYASLIREAEKNPLIRSHGSVLQTELARRLRPAAFLTYPCVCAETFCISALEGMAAGMKVLATRLGALEQTTMGYADLIEVEPGNGESLINDFRDLMTKNVSEFQARPEAWAEKMFAQIQAVNRACTWAIRAQAWEKLFASRAFS